MAEAMVPADAETIGSLAKEKEVVVVTVVANVILNVLTYFLFF